MIWVVGSALLLFGGLYLYSLFAQGEIRKLVRAMRWAVGGLLLAVAAIVGLRGNWFLASFIGAGGFGVITRGRLGPIDFGPGMSSPHNASSVKSHYFAMTLEHETSTVDGTVRAGQFSGRNLSELGPEECWALYDEVGDDPDSVALYESWLDANRAGWRQYFQDEFGMDAESASNAQDGHASSGLSGTDEAYELLGLKPGASKDAIRAAHRKLMKKVHPDAGGSAFLAAKINQAKDLLLKQDVNKA